MPPLRVMCEPLSNRVRRSPSVAPMRAARPRPTMCRMRGAVLIAALALGCSSVPAVEPLCTPGESRACTCPSGATGAQVCDAAGDRLGPCECAPPNDLDAGAGDDDAGERPHDAGRDAGHELERDGSADAGEALDASGRADSGSEPELDAGAPWGECSIVPQAGCGPAEACRRAWTKEEGGERRTSYPGIFEPRCEPSGPLEQHEPGDCLALPPGADEGQDQCAAGLFCDHPSGTCSRYCDPDAADPCPDPCRWHFGVPLRCVRRDVAGYRPLYYCAH